MWYFPLQLFIFEVIIFGVFLIAAAAVAEIRAMAVLREEAAAKAMYVPVMVDWLIDWSDWLSLALRIHWSIDWLVDFDWIFLSSF